MYGLRTELTLDVTSMFDEPTLFSKYHKIISDNLVEEVMIYSTHMITQAMEILFVWAQELGTFRGDGPRVRHVRHPSQLQLLGAQLHLEGHDLAQAWSSPGRGANAKRGSRRGSPPRHALEHQLPREDGGQRNQR